MIYTALSLVVLGIVGGILIVSLTTQQSVTTTSLAASSAQLVADTVETGIRNSTAFTLTTQPSGNQFLVARSAGAGSSPSWECVAWYYTAGASGSVHYLHRATSIAAPSSSDLASWTLLGAGISPTQGSTIFSGSTTVLSLNFKESSPGNPTVTIATSVTSQAGPVMSAPCF